nr:hypothetical protein Iba_chr14fCG14080 [Ipomoea batatas]
MSSNYQKPNNSAKCLLNQRPPSTNAFTFVASSAHVTVCLVFSNLPLQCFNILLITSLSRFTISTGPRGNPKSNSTSRSSSTSPPPKSNVLIVLSKLANSHRKSASTKADPVDRILILGNASSSSSVSTPSGAFHIGSCCNLERNAKGGETKSSSLTQL